MSSAFQRGLLALALLMATTGHLVSGESTRTERRADNSSQSSSDVARNSSRTVGSISIDSPQLDTNLVMLNQLKLMSIILDEANNGPNRQTARQSNQQPEDSDAGPSAKDGILVQQHYGGTTFFNRTWAEFKVGFGDVTSNYWIGNERLHQLTLDGRYKLRVDLLSKHDSQWYYAEYGLFRVLPESTKYILAIGDYSGTAGDRLQHANGMRFSTRDFDYDLHSSYHCAAHADWGNNGGFWYQSCGHVLINSPQAGTYGFVWYDLSGQGWASKLVVSRMTLFPR